MRRIHTLVLIVVMAGGAMATQLLAQISTVAVGEEVLFTDISADNEEAWYTITATPSGDGALGLYCSSAAAVVSPSAAASQYYSTRGANYAQQVVISPNSAHYWPDTLSTPNFTCSVANENLSGGAIAFTLTVDAALNATQITNDQQDAAQSLFDACCGGTSACPAWKAAATRSGAAALLDLCLMDGSICDSSGNLVQLNLEGEALLCPFPGETLAKFQKLQFLYLGSNSLTGDIGNIATALLSLVSLHELRLNANTGITGTLTSDMCVLASSGLTLLDLARTGISGSLPGCLFGADSGLLYLAAGSTGLSGTLPDTFSAASTLWQLKLGVAQLSGSMPSGLGLLPALQSLVLANNSLTGTIPAFASEQLQSLSLAHNRLTGGVPAALAGHTRLVQLVLTGNALTDLPDAWGEEGEAEAAAAAPLAALSLGGNALAGSFPVGLAAYPALASLDLSGNKLTGELPSAGTTFFPSLRYLFAGGNALEGSIGNALQESGIFNLAPLDANVPATWNTISLANNKLTGDIPTYMASAELDYPTNILLSVSRPRHVAGRAPSLSMFTWLCTSHRSLYLFASACQRWYIAKNTIRNSEALALDQARLHPPHDPTTQGNSFSNGCDTAFSNLASVCTSSSPPPPPSPSPPPSPGNEEAGGLSKNQKVGIAIGVFLLAIVGVVVCVWLARRRRHGTAPGFSGLGGNRFERFDDELDADHAFGSRPGGQHRGVELGPRGGGGAYGSSLSPSLGPGQASPFMKDAEVGLGGTSLPISPREDGTVQVHALEAGHQNGATRDPFVGPPLQR
ncbi:putative LRR receptor-like serine/threonine-protein kinase [Auxenochlorella protothecoides]|uniref:Putative LRR receptor-like serine/threonine-protein kinase n=2 Tax=Auxenochlorella protothecoides TaxID=3075 RepID=A0A087SCK6_AUXPR|nr:putative LRR receptor-like serine/threonine-protein kinase [Auxenochlorella protothecoides]KFM23460.1 putative LRR receptor-like serine/threonine-protein kinase [Auxenochlorella protothecoides]